MSVEVVTVFQVLAVGVRVARKVDVQIAAYRTKKRAGQDGQQYQLLHHAAPEKTQIRRSLPNGQIAGPNMPILRIVMRMTARPQPKPTAPLGLRHPPSARKKAATVAGILVAIVKFSRSCLLYKIAAR